MCWSEGYESLLGAGSSVRIVAIEWDAEPTAVETLCVGHHYEQTQSVDIWLCDQIKLDVTSQIPRGGDQPCELLQLYRSRHASPLNKQPVRWIHQVVAGDGRLNSGWYCLRSVRRVAYEELREIRTYLIAFGEAAEDRLQCDDVT